MGSRGARAAAAPQFLLITIEVLLEHSRMVLHALGQTKLILKPARINFLTSVVFFVVFLRMCSIFEGGARSCPALQR